MQLTDVALYSLRRRKGRMALLVVGLAIGVATVVALMVATKTMRTDVATKLDEYGANILVVPRSSDLSLSYGGVTVASAAYDVGELTMDDLERIGTIKNAANVSVVAPKLLGAVSLGGRPVLMAGVLFEDEIRLKQWWEVHGVYPLAPNEALAGARLAQTVDLKLDETVDVADQRFRIVGILEENGSQDDDILFVDLSVAQQMMDKSRGINLVEIAALCIACPIEEMVRQIGDVLPQARATALRQAVTLRMETVGQLSRFALAVSGVVTAIGGLVVLTTMLGAVSDRRQEIGLFRALGFRQRHVERVILTEAALVSLVGGALGWLIGMAVAALLTPAITNVETPVVWDPLLALMAIGGALLAGLLGSIYPAVRAAKLDPSVALRSL